MTAYIDSSVLLRVILGEPGRLRQWRRIRRPISSELTRIECLRTIDRARLRFRLSDAAVADHRAAILEQLDAFEIIPLRERVLERAAESFPTLVGTLDAIHLASAIEVRTQLKDLRFATHDEQLATAARAMGFEVLGRRRADRPTGQS